MKGGLLGFSNNPTPTKFGLHSMHGGPCANFVRAPALNDTPYFPVAVYFTASYQSISLEEVTNVTIGVSHKLSC